MSALSKQRINRRQALLNIDAKCIQVLLDIERARENIKKFHNSLKFSFFSF